jgi:hypothetical protein
MRARWRVLGERRAGWATLGVRSCRSVRCDVSSPHPEGCVSRRRGSRSETSAPRSTSQARNTAARAVPLPLSASRARRPRSAHSRERCPHEEMWPILRGRSRATIGRRKPALPGRLIAACVLKGAGSRATTVVSCDQRTRCETRSARPVGRAWLPDRAPAFMPGVLEAVPTSRPETLRALLRRRPRRAPAGPPRVARRSG